MVDIKALICEDLFRMYMMTSKTRKRKCEQVFMIDMKAQISIKGLFDL